jgi:transcriptional regulator with XRE-family HTH domain
MCEKGDKRQMRKELLKDLREARKQSIEKLSRRIGEQKKTIGAIMGQLEQSPKTVPEIASALGASSSQIMWWIAALKKFGEVVEGEKDGSYFRYEPARRPDVEPVSDSRGKDEDGHGEY